MTSGSDSDDVLRRAAWTLLRPQTVRDTHGLPIDVYIKRGSPEEIRARSALARLLRHNKLNAFELQCLADLIDPHSDRKHVRQELELHFRGRGGSRPQVLRDLCIASDVDDLRQEGQSFEAAVVTVGERYGLTEDAIKKLYGRIKRKLAAQDAARNKPPI